MRRSGFTLAETLITLTIIGVVAAITLPALSSRANDQANASKLGSSINAIENAFSMMVTREDADKFADTDFGQNQTETNIKQYLSQVTKSGTTYTMKNGATFTLSGTTSGSTLNIDVNGSKKPDKTGKDQFTYTLNEDGTLTPTGAALTLAQNNYRVTTTTTYKNNGRIVTPIRR